MSRVTVLLNSRSGTAAAPADVLAAFRQLGVEPEIVPLDGTQRDVVLTAAARGADVLVAAGGDGTINAAASLLVRSGSSAALGIMSMGTCNDLCRSLKLPDGLVELAEVVVRGKSMQIDVIQMEDGRLLINQANGGFSGVVAQELEDDVKARWGPLGYWLASLDALADVTEYEVTAVIDGERLQVSTVNLTVANGPYSGGGVPIAPRASWSDGKMDIVIVESRSRLALAALVPRVLRGGHTESEGIIYKQASTMELFARPDMPFSIDGEPQEEHPRRFEVQRGRLQIRVPG